MNIRRLFSSDMAVIGATVLGISSGYYQPPFLMLIAEGVSAVFINLLKLISLPIIFLSIVSTISGMDSFDEMQTLGKKVLQYTILTTIIAALVALGIFILINPVGVIDDVVGQVPVAATGSYWAFLMSVIPDNIMQTLSDNNNVMGVVFIAMILSFSILMLPAEQKNVLHTFFASLFGVILNLAKAIVFLMPLGVWAFITLFIYSLREGFGDIKSIFLYTICILAANLIQGFIMLPLFLKWKGISPIKTARGMMRALTIAFLSKSSNATLPITIECAQTNLKVSKRVANFSLPLCAVINMNGCAAFILITVLFVSMSHGVIFSMTDMLLWVIIATIAAIGNAGVPMGCYFLDSALLTSMGVPLYIMGIILPIYTLIDMVETALNVWSDACVAVVVNEELS